MASGIGASGAAGRRLKSLSGGPGSVGRALWALTPSPCAVPCRKALTRYQMLFRHLFYCKHVERQLCNVWISSKTAKQYSLHSSKW